MQPGQLVTCVGGDLLYFVLLRQMYSHCPRLGLVYTVSRVVTNCPSCGQDHVEVEEIAAPFVNGYPKRWFRPCRPVNLERFMRQLLPVSEVRVEG